LVDLAKVAARLDADEKLKLVYRFPVSSADGQVEHEVREGKLLDVAEDARLLYVLHNGDVIWVKVGEVVSVEKQD
jgi:hypothetical protein